MTTKKKLEDLTLKDNFMFGAVMIHPANCKPFLEMALGIPIGKLTVSMEKSLIYHPEYKGVRLDIEARDENKTRYNVEMQVVQKPFLEHRARYYHSQIDMDLLNAGGSYGELPDVYVVFLCDFDPIGLGEYKYTFQSTCQEDKEYVLPDGVTTVFLNTHGTKRENVPDGLIKFLEYVGSDLQGSNGDFQDGYVEQLQTAVRQIKANREMEEKFMLLEELLMDEREAGRAEGLEAGRAKGLAEAVLDLLQELSGEIPEDLKGRILAEKDSSILRHYLKTVSSAGSVEEFMAKLSH